MPFPTALAQMGAHNGRVYVVGGDNDFTPATGVLTTVAVFDIGTNTWLANGANMPTATSAAGYAQIGSFLYIVGGWGIASPGVNVNQTQRYDMATNTWTAGPTFTSARSDHALAATSVALYAIGGDNNGGSFFDLHGDRRAPGRFDLAGGHLDGSDLAACSAVRVPGWLLHGGVLPRDGRGVGDGRHHGAVPDVLGPQRVPRSGALPDGRRRHGRAGGARSRSRSRR